MKFRVTKSIINGEIEIPASKSHTIRSLFFSLLAKGKSIIKKPLLSNDGISALNCCKSFGAEVKIFNDYYEVTGVDSKPKLAGDIIDVGNSGTTMNLAISTASLIDGWTILTGDEQIKRRPVGPIVEAINNLAGTAITIRNDGKPPVIIKGIAKGGYTKLDGISSQYLTSLLIHTPLMEKDTEIELIRLFEVPYVDITLWWLNKLGIKYENNNYKHFFIKGNQQYKSFEQIIPADFSSATFFLVLAAISGGKIILHNLDFSDPQGDKFVVEILKNMGAKIEILPDKIIIEGNNLKGTEIDMNSIPDALPAMAVCACFAEGETKLVNVIQARYKETDRIKVMFQELSKMGADIKELDDGLIIKQSKLKPALVNGHNDHRVVMALSIAGLNIDGETIIDTAESASVTFPDFKELIEKCNGKIELIN